MVDGPSDRDDLLPTEPMAESEVLIPGTPADAVALPPIGYQLGRAIGRGGMGEVIAAFDQRIGREVAIKRMRSPHPSEEATTRFLREARIQARLDHPAIVPVHELGTDEAGRPYFTMKRLAGRTLGQRMAEAAPQRQLLRAFVDVCLAVEFAHAKGVVHRDLKPANIMLGDYGEVYVLDWGIARVLAEPVGSPPASSAPPVALESIDSLDEGTKTGTLLGTPGYISPEQLKGDAVTAPADVYALGSILFELLAGEPLHPRSHQKAIASTLATPQEWPARRRPERGIPPELDQACSEALAEDPAERPTAHQLAHRVQAYLDGDRDIERRRSLAVQQLRSAREVLASNDPDRRSTALRRAGRALALDPESEGAGELVSSLLLEPPDVAASPALAASLDDHERHIARDRSRKAIYAYLSTFALLPVVFLLDVKNWVAIGACYAALGLGLVTSWIHSRTGRPSVPVVLGVTFTIAILFTRIASPFILTPLLICCALAAVTSIPAIAERRWLVMAWTLGAVMTPFLCEWLGLLPATWRVTSKNIEIGGDLFYARGSDEEIALILAHLLFTLVVGWLAVEISRRRLSAQRQLYVQAWHLGQLVPGPSTGIPGTGLGRRRTVQP
ncbi:MAG TPA: serine/threonine-protein kinase [Kofleriaceae bacterium]|nr:serine/threonine-protein kinase [Kofleriaceae bacterium]